MLVRSTEAHADIVSIDTSAAKEHPGVVAVLTGEEMAGDFPGPLASVWNPPGVEVRKPDHWPLKRGQVKHVGDPVAVVVAASRGVAFDAAEDVIVDYEPKPAVVDVEAALEDGAALVWESLGTNKTHEWGVSGGDMDAALAEADVTVTKRFVNHRTSGTPIEPRCSVAEPRGEGIHALFHDTDSPHRPLHPRHDARHSRGQAARGGPGRGRRLRRRSSRCTARRRSCSRSPSASAAWSSGPRPRSEHMTTVHHGRDQINTVTLGAKSDGTITGCKAEIIADLGAYIMLLTPSSRRSGSP